MRNALIGFGSALILLSAISAGPAAAVPAKAVKCGDTVTTTTRLTRDLRCGAIGLVMMPGATLDLGGHRLIGQGTKSGGHAIGTDATSTDFTTPLTVKNGIITGWHDVLVTGASTLHANVSNVTFTGNGNVLSWPYMVLDVKSSRFFNNNDVATSFGGGRITVDGSTFVGNHLALSLSEGRIVANNSSFRNNATAIAADWTGVTLRNNTFTGNGTAYTSDSVWPFFEGIFDSLIANRFVDNGVALDLGVGAYLRGNLFQRNDTALRSVWHHVDPQAVVLVMEQNTLTQNRDAVHIEASASLRDTVAINNSGHGIYAPGATDLGGNVAYGNGIDPQCTGVVCSGRPRPGPTPSRRS